MTKFAEATVRHPFPPLVDENSRILILGSLPSVASRAQGFYYMHPRNRFWAVMSALLGTDLTSADVETKKRTLLQHGIALHDVIRECRITGSGDASIRGAVPSDIRAILAAAPIEAIYLNGSTAYKLFLKYFPDLGNIAHPLPSTSPANAKWTSAALTKEWGRALEALRLNSELGIRSEGAPRKDELT